MLDDLSREGFVEWMAYYHLEPFGQEWLQAGHVCAAVGNFAGGGMKGGGKFQPADFMPVRPPEIVLTDEQLEARLTGWADAHNARRKAEGL